MKKFTQPLHAQALALVSSENTAITVRSGSLEVFATPSMIALMEKATCSACADLLDEGETTVGIAVNVSHERASGLGTLVKAQAVLTAVDGRKLMFEVTAMDERQNIIGKGTITRFVVNSEQFMSKVESK